VIADPTHSFSYVACDIPPGMTIAEWKRRKAHATAAAGPRRRSLLGRLGLAAV
jgi:hypothetical protein